MKQLSFSRVGGWGGRRRGAGRKKSGLVNHMKRAAIGSRHPALITWKLKTGVVSLRHPRFLAEFRKAVGVAKKFGLRVIHFSIQSDHIHLFVEANDGRSLASGMRSLGSRFGKAVRKAIGGRGSVFVGRYHAHILRTPTEVKNALKYVLLNYSKHSKLIEHVDDFSSGYAFREWAALIGRKWNGLLSEQLRGVSMILEELSVARSWLAREGWKRSTA